MLYDHLTSLSQTKFDFSNFELDSNPDVVALPDGTFEVYEANDNMLSYNARINDHHVLQYHRNNGITKMGILIQDKENTFKSFVHRQNEGLLEAISIVNNAYIEQLYNTTVISGFNFMPFKFNIQENFHTFMDAFNQGVLPFCLVLGFPVFLMNIVFEKEHKLIEIMKINGLRMNNYWTMQFAFNLVYYWLSAFVFLFAGRFIF